MSAFSTTGKRKEDVSAKLRAETFRNQRNTKQETKNLEVESRKMEERLQELKMAMSREKEERERSNFNGYWKTGALGKLSNYGTDAMGKHSVKQHKEAKKKTVKVLKDEPVSASSRKPVIATPGSLAFIAQKGGGSAKIKGPKCGQCEAKGAHVSCLECGEDYCATCFASFHMKGALKKHRSVPIGSSTTPRTPRGIIDPIFSQPDPPPKETNPMKVTLSEIDFDMEKSRAIEEMYPSESNNGGGGQSSLMDGQYNEADAAAEFQAALNAWRGGGGDEAETAAKTMPSNAQVESSDTGTGMEAAEVAQRRRPVDIRFTNTGLTYAEKLLLKKHRRTDVDGVSSGSPRAYSQASSAMTLQEARASMDDEDRVDFGAISSAVASLHNGHTQEPDEMRTESRVSIVDWDDAPMKSRGMEQSSNYQVTELTDFVDYSAIPNEWKHPDDRKVAFGTPRVSTTPSGARVQSPRVSTTPTGAPVHSPTPPTTPTPIRAYNRPGSKNKKLKTSTDTKGNLTKSSEIVNKENVAATAKEPPKSGRKSKVSSRTPVPKPQKVDDEQPTSARVTSARSSSLRKTWTKDFSIVDDFQKTLDDLRKKEKDAETQGQERPQSRAKSRLNSARSRPASSRRPKSRAQTRMELFGEGVLTKGPSTTLKEIASLKPSAVAAPGPSASSVSNGLAEFFLVGVQPSGEQQERTMTPSGMRSARKEKGFKISNKLYQMGPRSWHPDTSLGTTVTDDAAMAHLDEVGVQQFRQFTDVKVDADGGGGGQEEYNAVEFTLSGGIKRTSVLDYREDTESITPRPLSTKSSHNAPVQDVRPKSQKSRPTKTPPSSARKAKSHSSPRVSSSKQPEIMSRSQSRSKSRAESRSGRESTMIVVDGDDMSQYDEEKEEVEDEEEEGEETLNQLEWELASISGRVEDDGKVSRMDLPEDDNMSDDLDLNGRDLITPVNTACDPGFDIDTRLRASELMDDFEEMEKQIEDEQEVHALK